MNYRCLRHRGFKFDVKKSALLIIDMQGYFTAPASRAYVKGSSKIIKNINILARMFYNKKRPVIFTRHIDIDKKNLMCRWWKENIDKKSPFSAVDERMLKKGAKVIIKHSYDAFLGTPLERILRCNKVEQVVVTGVVTHLCCETTARSAFMREFVPFFVIDATGAHKKKHHEAAIFNLSRGFAVPVRTDELIG